MLSSPREKRLAMLFGGTIAAMVLWETVGQLLWQPLSEKHMQLTAAETVQSTLQDQAATIEHALRNLKQLSNHSLPADSGKASVLYQGWLIRTLAQNSIASAVVTPTPAIIETGVGHRIPFTVQCQATSQQIARFLDQFYATPLLHRLTNLDISSTTAGQSSHRVTLSIEALAFDTATEISQLPIPGTPVDEYTLEDVFNDNDIFRRKQKMVTPPTYAAQPKPAARPVVERPVEPKPNATDSVRFVASVWNGQQREAWFVDQRSQQESSLIATSALDFPEINGKVLLVSDDTLQLELAGKQGTLKLGQTLGDVVFAN